MMEYPRASASRAEIGCGANCRVRDDLDAANEDVHPSATMYKAACRTNTSSSHIPRFDAMGVARDCCLVRHDQRKPGMHRARNTLHLAMRDTSGIVRLKDTARLTVRLS